MKFKLEIDMSGGAFSHGGNGLTCHGKDREEVAFVLRQLARSFSKDNGVFVVPGKYSLYDGMAEECGFWETTDEP